MRNACLVFVSLLVFTVSAVAAPPPEQRSDRWDTPPPAASSSTYRMVDSHTALPAKQTAEPEHFTFKKQGVDSRHSDNPLNKPPPRAMDKASVMGAQRPWQDGRPPVDCASAPMDPACR